MPQKAKNTNVCATRPKYGTHIYQGLLRKRLPIPMSVRKPVSLLQISDLQEHPVWQFVSDDEDDDTVVRPVTNLPVTAVTGKVIGTRVSLANGRRFWAIIGNLDARNAQMNEHLITLSIERNGQWFHLARYHDPTYLDNGPHALATFLELPVGEIFPISYDLREYVKGAPAALVGTVLEEPRVRLTRAQIIDGCSVGVSRPVLRARNQV